MRTIKRPAPRPLPLTLALALLAWAQAAPAATSWEASIDARLVDSNAQPSFMHGGLGTVRFGSDDSGLQLGRLRFALTQSIGELWSAHVDLSMFDNLGPSPVGVTEAYLLFRPFPFAGWRLRVKAGAFYPPISLENGAPGWESPYSLSYSAIDSWLATEVRTIGLEGRLEWLGTRSGHDIDAGFTAGAFGWNQDAGVVLANDGFSLTDRQTPVFGHVGQPADAPLYGAQPFVQFDHHAGLYGGVEVRYLDRLVLRGLHYDNRADPNAVDAAADRYAYATSFNSAGARLDAGHGVTLVAQWLDGETTSSDEGRPESWPFKAEYALIAERCGRHTLSARYDWFDVHSIGTGGYGAQSGHALTAAYVFQANAHWRATLEWVQVVSRSYSREELGAPAQLTETQLQLAVRYAFGATLH